MGRPTLNYCQHYMPQRAMLAICLALLALHPAHAGSTHTLEAHTRGPAATISGAPLATAHAVTIAAVSAAAIDTSAEATSGSHAANVAHGAIASKGNAPAATAGDAPTASESAACLEAAASALLAGQGGCAQQPRVSAVWHPQHAWVVLVEVRRVPNKITTTSTNLNTIFLLSSSQELSILSLLTV